MNKKSENRKMSTALLKGSSFRVIQTVISIGIGFWMLPFLIRYLGSEDYALWILIGSIISTYYLMDLGLNQAVTRYVARYIYAEEYQRANKIINTALVIYSILGLMLMLATTLAAIFIVPQLLTEVEEIRTAQAIILIAGLSISLEFPSKAFPGIISAYLRYDTIALVRTLGTILNAISVYFFISNGYGVISLALISLVVNLFTTAFFVYYSYNLLSSLELKRSHISKKDMLELFNFSKWTFIVDITNLAKKKMDLWLIAAFISGSAITTYYVAARLTEYAAQLAAQGLGFGMPVFTKYYAQQQYDKMAQAVQFFIKLNVIVFALFLSGFIVLGDSFIKLWVSSDEINHSIAFQCLIILATGRLMVFVTQPLVSLLMTIKKHKYATYLSVIDTILAVTSAFVLVPRYGVIGAAISFALIIGCIRLICLPIMVTKLANISFNSLITKVCMFITYSGISTCFLDIFIGSAYTWFEIAYYSPLVVLTILIGTYMLFSQSERAKISDWVAKKLNTKVPDSQLK
jgi:O-antigen/teichoic acid export membrane protein